MKLSEALNILGFEKSSVLPKLKEIQKHFHRLSKTKHPDKNNGSKESTAEFQTLLDAYRIAGKAAEKVVPEKDDFEDIIAHKVFQQFQFSSVKVNSQSVTIKTEKLLNSIWQEVLTSNLGEPIVNKDEHGKKFTLVDKCEEPSTNVYITLYHTGNLLVQAQGNKQSVNIHFINSHLKDLFIQVYNRSKLLPKSLMNQSHKTPLRKLTKTCKNPLKKIKCPKCDYLTNITAQLAKHMKKEHGNSVVRRLSTSPEDDKDEDVPPPPNNSPIPEIECDLCGSSFNNESEKSRHIKSVHEVKCTLCHHILYDRFDLEIHMNIHKTPTTSIETDTQEITCNYCDSNFYTDADFRLHMSAYHTKHEKNSQKNAPKTLVQELTEVGEIPLVLCHQEITQETFEECNSCGIVFSDSEDFERHKPCDHSKTAPYNCDKCPFTTTEEVVFKHHTLMLHVPGFECHECKKMIFPDDHVLGCSNCNYFFHMHCTNLHQQGLEPTLSWRCQYCSQKSIELQTPEPSTCNLCAFEAGNTAALETHLLNNHCPDIAAQCDSCDKRFASNDILQIHISNHHATELETSEVTRSESAALPTCKTCNITLNEKELSITCDNCQFIFHKKCTELKKAGGHWKPSTWNCESCRPTANSNKTPENLNAVSRLAAKHRKSNAIGCEHPDKEFLVSQINTLKSIVAKREAELKKVQESDNLKAKRIMQLEAQLFEARKFENKDNSNHTETRSEDHERRDMEIANLVIKTDNLQTKVELLLKKFDNSQTVNTNTSTTYTGKLFICDVCESEFDGKPQLQDHKESIHGNIEHTRNPQLFKCLLCEHNARSQQDLKDHATKHHEKCNECYYFANNLKDLRRHKRIMHSSPSSCNICYSNFTSREQLQDHVTRTHTNDAPTYCHFRGENVENQKNMKNHIPQYHTHRTRIYSSSRFPIPSNTNFPTEPIFRPWSSATATAASHSSSSYPSVPSIPPPFTWNASQMNNDRNNA